MSEEMRDVLCAADGETIPAMPKKEGGNLNTLITGGTGSGKTFSVVAPTLVHTHDSSVVVTMSKNGDKKAYMRMFEDRGYKVFDIDFTDSEGCNAGYDPLDNIETEEDITRLAEKITDNPKEETKLANLSGYGTYYGNYVAVFKEVGKTSDKIVEKTVSTNAGNHTIALKMNEAPAYTGGKLRATDFISSFKIDGKEYPAKDIKIKVEGDKKVGSKVKVTIKKIKGADKQTNKDVKGTVLGEVTIRPIDVSEVTTWNKTFTKEGQIVVKTNKNGDIKSVAAVVSKKGVNSGDNKAKKLKVKKGTYTYDSAKKTITFNDGAICKGTVSLNAAK